MIFFPLTLGSTVVTRFVATMMSLTAASRLATFLRWQLSCVHGTFLPWHTTTNHPNIPHDGFRISSRGLLRMRTRASPLTSKLAVLLRPNRVHFRCRLSGSYPLLSTPPRGGAVTSSSHPEHGSRWPRSSTPEDRDASQRTSHLAPRDEPRAFANSTTSTHSRTLSSSRGARGLVRCEASRSSGVEDLGHLEPCSG